ncbi:hypothetical protein ACFYZE_13340 [Streptomyces sp. NPDC001796]|uniref:hypothetical protein n=1 Tax=Streptomyces sp. NPDC001796 TaxID=3364609 RepID=UPI00367841A2
MDTTADGPTRVPAPFGAAGARVVLGGTGLHGTGHAQCLHVSQLVDGENEEAPPGC